jgi:hypothetical protein
VTQYRYLGTAITNQNLIQRKLRGDWIWVMLATIQCKTFCSTNREKRNTYRILVWKPEGKGPLGRSRCRWVDNIKIGLREIGWNRIGLNWSGWG